MHERKAIRDIRRTSNVSRHEFVGVKQLFLSLLMSIASPMPVGDQRHVVNSFTTSEADAEWVNKDASWTRGKRDGEESTTCAFACASRDKRGQTFNEFSPDARIGGGSPSYS